MINQKPRDILFVIPALLFIAVFLLWPTLMTLQRSFFIDDNFVGLESYRSLFADFSFQAALKNNLIWIVFHLPGTVFPGLLLALLISDKVFLSGALRTIIFVGMVIPMVIGGILTRFLFAKDSGMISTFLGSIGLHSFDVNWLGKPELALPALIIISIWLWMGYPMIVYLSALTSIPTSLVEAGQLDGASRWQSFRYIVFPFLIPPTGIVVIMTTIWELKIFDIVYSATGGGPGDKTNVLALEMYMRTFRSFRFSEGAATGIIMTLLALPPIIFFVRAHSRRDWV